MNVGLLTRDALVQYPMSSTCTCATRMMIELMVIRVSQILRMILSCLDCFMFCEMMHLMIYEELLLLIFTIFSVNCTAILSIPLIALLQVFQLSLVVGVKWYQVDRRELGKDLRAQTLKVRAVWLGNRVCSVGSFHDLFWINNKLTIHICLKCICVRTY